jgi:Transposase and inactivated derivatives
MRYVWHRAALLAHLTGCRQAEGLEALTCTKRNRSRWAKHIVESYEGKPSHQLAAACDFELVFTYDGVINDLEIALKKHALKHHAAEYRSLTSVPGIGMVLALTILYEIDTVERFETVQDLVSYSRLVGGNCCSAGKVVGSRGGKMGNPYLKWAFREAAILCKRADTPVGNYAEKLLRRKQGNKKLVNGILASKICRAVYHMLHNGTVFDPKRFVSSN